MSTSKKVLLENCSSVSPKDLRNQLRMAAWILIWAFSWVAVKYGIRHEWLAKGAVATAATVLQTGIGLFMIVSFRRYLREADELQRKIQLDALALAVGVTLVGSVCYSLLQMAGLPVEKEVFDVSVLLICFTYSGAVFFSQWRYS